ncbi:hypothetical protein [Ruegeria arenilitoris]|uniref:hypothetical protein n=1 Tax=Ruegeria arenilitoris TaxID=1173585 RepID=UPI00147BB5BB|nr:hypothetical protein [Ruegeria arenilitoris]
MFLKFLTFLGFGLASVSALHAEEEIVVQLNTRTFYAGEDFSGRDSDAKFLPINRLDWLNEMLKEIPLLDNTVIHIKQLNPGSDSLWSPTGPGGGYPYPEPIPNHLRLPGYTVHSSGQDGFRLLYLTPKSSQKQYAIGCTAERDSNTYEWCGLRARYPLDPLVMVLTRIYNPPSMDQLDAFFKEIAELTVGIALCLDVTDQNEKNAQQSVREYLTEEAEIRCADGLTS